MTMTTISGREFNQDIARAKRAANDGPVIITDRGTPAFVLQRYEDWHRQAGGNLPRLSLLDALADPAGADIDFDPPKISGPLSKPTDLEECI